MIDCNAARELLALEPTSEDTSLQGHLAECEALRRAIAGHSRRLI